MGNIWAGEFILSPIGDALTKGAARSRATAIYAERLEDRLKLALAQRGYAGQWPWERVFAFRGKNQNERSSPISAEHAVAARAILAHADPLGAEIEAAMRRILDEAADNPRTVDGSASKP